jgi:hypothetical protein
MGLKAFFRPSIIKISFALLCIGLTLLFVTPFFRHIVIVPCMLVGSGWALCPINPTVEPGTMYFGSIITDNIYLFTYLLGIVILVPYTMSCSLFWLYERFIKNVLSRVIS